MNIIKKSKESARKRSIDNYGKSIELAITSYLLDTGKFPTEVSQLNIEYSGSKVECGVELINKDTTVYLDKCKVNNKLVDNYKYGIDKRTAVEVLLSKTNSIEITNYNDGNKGEMYTFNHEATEQTPALTDYRYIGNVPNNYVSFNNGETWRIIGVFDVDDGQGNYEKRIKLVANDSLGNKKWNSDSNEWVGSTMQIYLNDMYNIDDASEEIVDTVKWYLGGRGNNSADGETFYVSERSETVVSDDRSKNWIGKKALIYQSDYIYAYSLGVDDTCYNSPSSCDNSSPSLGWLYKDECFWWTLVPNSVRPFLVGYVNSSGAANLGGASVDRLFGTIPAVYLKPETKIKQGDGTIDNPYIFEL